MGVRIDLVALTAALAFDITTLIPLLLTLPQAFWTIIIYEAAPWPEAVITIGLTFAGGVLGQLIFASKDAMTQKPWGLWAYLSLFLIQTVIWAVLWIYGWMGSRREKTLGRTVALEDMFNQETGRQQQEYRTYYGAFDRA